MIIVMIMIIKLKGKTLGFPQTEPRSTEGTGFSVELI
jgi:hypothetical protein